MKLRTHFVGIVFALCTLNSYATDGNAPDMIGNRYGIVWHNQTSHYIALYISNSQYTCMSGYEGQPTYYPTLASPLIIPPGTTQDPGVAAESWYVCHITSWSHFLDKTMGHLNIELHQCDSHSFMNCPHVGSVDLEAHDFGYSEINLGSASMQSTLKVSDEKPSNSNGSDLIVTIS
jgi:hypothetical protein